MKVKRIERTLVELPEIIDYGYNMLADADIKVIDRATGKTPVMKHNIVENENAVKLGLVANENQLDHIDIMCDSADLIFDLKREVSPEKIFISSFHTRNGNYILEEFAVFTSDSEETLFDDENMIIHEKVSEEWRPVFTRNHADWLYEAEGSFRFFGVRFYKANKTDDIIRPENIGIYNSEHTQIMRFAKNVIGDNPLKGFEPQALTNEHYFDDEDTVAVSGEETFIFNTKSESIDKVWVITKGEAEISVNSKIAQKTFTKLDRVVYEVEPEISGGDLSVKVCGNVLVDQISYASAKRTGKVSFCEVLNEDYLSIGANVLPMALMPESINNGYNKAYWELEKRRIMLVRPNVVRMWFQPDWIFETREDYENCRFNYDTEKMQSVYAYLDAFREAGTEIEFNFGWKVSTNIQEWFSFPDLPTPSNSAPKELEPFARCCGEILNELINNRKYDNIKYLTFYNEPDYGAAGIVDGDFVVIGHDRKEYWEQMALLCRAEIDKKGLEHIKIWGAEESGNDETQSEWMSYFDDKDVLDMHTTHRYRTDANSNRDKYFKFIKECCKNKPVIISECGQCYDIFQYNWNMSHVQHFCDFTNAGISGGLIWCLNSVDITDPCSFTMRNGIDMWDTPHFAGGIENVREVFYEWAMLCRYVPKHCKSVKTEVTTNERMRMAAIKTDSGDYTIVVEIDKAKIGRNIEVTLDMPINKKMYRHIYKRPSARNGNALLPPVSKELFVEDKIVDEVSGDYMEIVYTTIPPVHQIVLPTVELLLEPGQEYTLSAENVDGFGEIAWSVAENIGDSFDFGLTGFNIKAKEDAKKGDMCALKAYNIFNPEVYSIMIVKIK